MIGRNVTRGFVLIILAAFAMGLWSCKTTKTTRKTSEDETPDAETSDNADVDNSPVTVFPDGSVVGTGDIGGVGDTSGPDVADTSAADTGTDTDAPSGHGEVWVPDEGDFVLRDKQTGSLWNVRGEAFRGPLKGKSLEQVPAFNSFWFAWSIFYHGSEIWQRKGDNIRNTPGEIERDDKCLVPCDDIEMGCPGKDCIPALDYKGRKFAGRERPRPAQMVEPDSDKAGYLSDSDYVFGVVIDGEARAYPHNIYWWHEIHNDKIGDREFSVTFCPLTGSGIVFEGRHDGEPIRYGVSGRLYNANLVMFDPGTGTFWSQMLGRGIKGERIGDRLDRLPVVETTWERWKEMYPDTLVTSGETGYDRNYQSYPYGDYRTDDTSTFGADQHQTTYGAKDRVLGLPGSTKQASLAFGFPELRDLPGDRNVVHETFEGDPIVVVFENEHRMAIPYKRTVDGRTLTFVGETAQ